MKVEFQGIRDLAVVIFVVFLCQVGSKCVFVCTFMHQRRMYDECILGIVRMLGRKPTFTATRS